MNAGSLCAGAGTPCMGIKPIRQSSVSRIVRNEGTMHVVRALFTCELDILNMTMHPLV
jgi:hypothetical protein